jgi:membrane protein implicated in regulation of membrane protease activity
VVGAGQAAIANLGAMLAAEIWHWWIGVVLVAVAILAVVALVAGYLKNVTAKQYPNRRQRGDG